MTFFDIRIPGLKLIVVAADGQDVEPVTVDEFRIGLAEVYDVIVEPKDDRAYTIFAQSLDRSGYARGTLAPQPGMQAEVPPLDPRPLLTMMDMGMAHDMAGMDMSGMDMSSMKGMDHGSMQSMDHDMSNMPGMDQSAMDHSAMAMGDDKGSVPHHAPVEYGPNVDSLAMEPQTRLDDPGIGLRKNGRRVLTYADLHTLGGPIDHRQAGRDIELHLTGHMERYGWSFNGRKFSEAEPLRFHYGERLRLGLVNDSMMHHPIHLHGMWGEVESVKGDFLV